MQRKKTKKAATKSLTSKQMKKVKGGGLAAGAEKARLTSRTTAF